MKNQFRIDLQLFAGEGAAPGGDGAGEGAAGENAAAAGQERSLESLGVPKDKAERFRKRKAGKEPTRQSEAQQQDAAGKDERTAGNAGQEGEQEDATAAQSAAQADSTQAEAGEAERKTLKQLLQEDPQLNSEMQEIVKGRLKDFEKAEGKSREAMKQLEPGLKRLMRYYGMTGDLDVSQLADAIKQDKRLLEPLAEELGTTTDIADKLIEREELIEAEKKRRDDEREQQLAREHFDKLWQQGEELKKVYPNFDLRAEMQNPVFYRMVMPGGGLTVKQAFMALHGEELRQAEAAAIAEKVKEDLARSIAAGQGRPTEGKRGQAASSGRVATPLTREEREALKQRIRQSAYTGEKIFPGR